MVTGSLIGRLGIVFLAFGMSMALAQERLGVGGGPAGGSFFPIATGIAETINRNVPHLSASAEATGGGAENIVLIGDQRIDFGIVTMDLLYDAHHQHGDFEGRGFDHVAIMTPGTYDQQLLYVHADSDVESVEDLAGRRVQVGPAGSASAVMWQRVFEHQGIDIRAEFMSYSDAASTFRDGLIAAIVNSTGNFVGERLFENPTMVELEATADLRAISPFADDAAREGFFEAYPLYVSSEVAPGTFEFIAEPLEAVGIQILLGVRGDLDEQVVYDVVSALFENPDQLEDFHPYARGYGLEEGVRVLAASGPPVPFHPGALRYYEERGLIE